MSVSNNNASYRRGILLGLTMAEIIILIIFLLLLAFATLLDREKKANEARDYLIGNKEVFERIVHIFSSQPPDMAEDVVRAIDALPSVISLIKDKDLSKEGETVNETLVRAVTKLEVEKALTESGSEVPVEEKLLQSMERIKELEADAQNLADQKQSLISQIESKGKGVDLPPCWPGRTTEYLFNIDLTSAGIVMKDSAPAHRIEERNRLPLQRIVYEEARSISQFRNETAPILEWSNSKQCRFYVFVTDKTGATEKALFKQLLIAVEGSFYKKLSSISPSIDKQPSGESKNKKSFFEDLFSSEENSEKNDGYN